MEYVLSFLEGIITFVSPCLLPMLPIYISYFGGQKASGLKSKAIINAAGFVAGFTILFVALGAFAGSLGSLLSRYQNIVNIITGIVIILFGLNFMEVITLPWMNQMKQYHRSEHNTGFFSSLLFGIIFSISWTPCVGTFLGSALMLAASTGETVKGLFMLLSFSLGLGIPFIASAVMIDNLKSTFDLIKRHYQVINRVSGLLLILLGVAIATGLMGEIYALM